ncbi:hypothetical protein VOLCADRAFT_86511 [Volvox carteri f. nagariensis]|uniref:DNA helicase n=1 Tax=Volvox carteri f. nagariensis TaxID=3068 RepID=D8TIV4_VOLCA|nr:uncharacterized protein VOLCADRAFT_86511 [Volvox carteri f. nagariensis]EFJ52432.1 hypothetical protein VOLCADRAFT_86511 [Volvox carteri f. nagariensis]|eukprot:XP_002946505.1 hypothetical protein VOLCADRAFT_86511 [Volvox carteri f. nagariensis]
MDVGGSDLPFEGGLLLSPEPDKSRRSPLPSFSGLANNNQRARNRNSDAPFGSQLPFQAFHEQLEQHRRQGQFFQIGRGQQQQEQQHQEQQQQQQQQQQQSGLKARKQHRDDYEHESSERQQQQQPPAKTARLRPEPLPAASSRYPSSAPHQHSSGAGRLTHGSPIGRDSAEDGGGDGSGGSGDASIGMLAYLISSGVLDDAVVEDSPGQPRLREGAVALQAETHLGASWMQDPKGASWGLMDELHREGLSASTCPRVWLRPTQVPLPCQPVDALMAFLAHLSAMNHGSSSLSSSSGSPALQGNNNNSSRKPQHMGSPSPSASASRHAFPVCCYGVVVAASSLSRRPYSRVLVCPRCGTAVEVLDERGLPPGGGCSCGGGSGWGEGILGFPPTWGPGGEEDFQEDLSGRVMVDVQDLWLGPLGSPSSPSSSSSSSSPAPEGATGGSCFFTRLAALKITCEDDLAGIAKVGDVVRVVGLVRLFGPPATGRSTSAAAAAGSAAAAPLRSAAAAAATAELEALSISQVSPLTLWARPGAAGGGGGGGGVAAAGGLVVSRSRQPLQLLCDLLTQLLKRTEDPLVKLALLLSAVSVPGPRGPVQEGPGGASSDGFTKAAGAPPRLLSGASNRLPEERVREGGGGRWSDESAGASRSQLSLLMGSEAPADPLGPRLLRAAAALLCPHTVVLGGGASGGLLDDPMAARLQASTGRADVEGLAGGVAHGSALLTVGNRGIVVVEAEQLSAKHKAQLCDTLSKPVVTLAPGRPELSIPVTATVWASACRHATSDGGGAASSMYGSRGRRGGRGAYGGGFGPVPGSCRGGWSGLDESRFDVVLELPPNDDVAATFALDAGSLGEGAAAAADGLDEVYMRDALRSHVAAAALMSPSPQLSDAALELLMRYYVAVRQSGVQVTQSEVLRSLVKLATASARLHLRCQVLESPDCVLAVLLMERTLSGRFGDSYMGLGLPPMPEGTGLGDEGEGDESMEWQLDGGGGGSHADSVDASLQCMKGTLARCLRGFTPIDWQVTE